MKFETSMIFYILGPSIFLWSIYIIFRAKSSRGWPSVTGKILQTLESYTKECHFGSSAGSSSRIESYRSPSIKYSGVRSSLKYGYVIANEKYIGGNLYSAKIFPIKDAIVDDLSIGDLVKVFYNPNNPHDSFLAHSYTTKTILVMLLGIIITLFPLALDAITKLS